MNDMWLVDFEKMPMSIDEKMCRSIEKSDENSVRELLDGKANINEATSDIYGNSVAHIAAQHSTPALIDMILEKRPDMAALKNKFSQSPLHKAVEFARHFDFDKEEQISRGVVQPFLEARADVCAVDDHLQTPLHMAVISDDIETVLLLIKFQAPVDVKDMYKLTPTDYCHDKNPAIRRALEDRRQYKDGADRCIDYQVENAD
jgi:ankyrin repeat protein